MTRQVTLLMVSRRYCLLQVRPVRPSLFTEYDVLDYGGGNVGITAATLASAEPITVIFSRLGSSVQLTWPYGTLLQATNVTGPWAVNRNASPPSYTVTPTGPQMFYRVQVQ
jgi:hypothetical protein